MNQTLNKKWNCITMASLPLSNPNVRRSAQELRLR